jgi:hypothetical protein
MQAHEQALTGFRRRLAVLLTLRNALAYFTAWAFVWGTGVLVLRAALGTPRPVLLWGLAGLPLALVPAVWLALRRLPSAAAVRALFDHRGGLGGLLMAGAEMPLGAWDRRVPELAAPRVRWRAGRAAGLFAVAAGFVGLAFATPQRLVALDAGTPLDIGREVTRLHHQIDTLKEEQVLDSARADALKQKLDQVREEASGTDPVKTLEALDHLEDVTSKTAKSAAEAAASKTEQMSKAETLAEALRDAGDKADPRLKAEAMAELAALARQAAGDTELMQGLDAEALKALEKAGALDPQMMKKIADAMRGGKKKLAARLENLERAGLLDKEALKKLALCARCNGKELAQLLCDSDCEAFSLADLLAQCDKPGRGGLTRGPGAAKLTFGKESTMDGVQFKEETLPPSALQALQESKVLGVTPTAPQVETAGAESKPGALAGARAGGGSANTQVILPRHREAVEKYFERPPPKK